MTGYIKYNELLTFGISESYLKKACNYYRNGKSHSWENIKDFIDKRKVWIKLNSIPVHTREKYNIPTAEQLEAKKIAETNEKTNLLSDINALKLSNAFNEAYGGYLQLYWNRLEYSQEKQIEYSKKIRSRTFLLGANGTYYWLVRKSNLW